MVAAIVGLLGFVVLSLVLAEVGAKLLIGVLLGLRIRCVPTTEAITGLVTIQSGVRLRPEELHP